MTPQKAILKLIAYGWTQNRVAKAAGISQPSVSRFANGTREPGYATGAMLVKLAQREGRK